MSEEGSKNIYQRIHEVMEKIKYIKKDTTVTGGGTYKAVSHDNVIAQIRAELLNSRIAIIPTQLSGEVLQLRDMKAEIKMHLYKGDYIISFICIDNPESKIDVNIQAHANDNGDKAPGKCFSYAVKTAILKTFMIETGVNDESRNPDNKKPVEKISEEDLQVLEEHIDGNDEISGRIKKAYNLESLSDLAASLFPSTLKRIKEQKK